MKFTDVAMPLIAVFMAFGVGIITGNFIIPVVEPDCAVDKELTRLSRQTADTYESLADSAIRRAFILGVENEKLRQTIDRMRKWPPQPQIEPIVYTKLPEITPGKVLKSKADGTFFWIDAK